MVTPVDSTAIPSILFAYESNPESTRYFLIPANAEISVNLRKAVIGINGFMVNASQAETDAKVWKHWAYVNAALTLKKEHLSNDNVYDENRFFGCLLEYEIDSAEFGGETLIEIDGPFLLVRGGIIM